MAFGAPKKIFKKDIISFLDTILRQENDGGC
jgi:hypothetical protein